MDLEKKVALKHEKIEAKWKRRKGFTGKSAKWKAKWDKWLKLLDKKLEAK